MMAVESLRVLLVGDGASPVIRNQRLKLELDEYHVDIASSVPEALEMALAEPPDLMFVDLELLGIQAPAFLSRLRADLRTQNLPVVFMSSSLVELEESLELRPHESLIRNRMAARKYPIAAAS